MDCTSSFVCLCEAGFGGADCSGLFRSLYSTFKLPINLRSCLVWKYFSYSSAFAITIFLYGLEYTNLKWASWFCWHTYNMIVTICTCYSNWMQGNACIPYTPLFSYSQVYPFGSHDQIYAQQKLKALQNLVVSCSTSLLGAYRTSQLNVTAELAGPTWVCCFATPVGILFYEKIAWLMPLVLNFICSMNEIGNPCGRSLCF